jgi:formylglycine-generating enzyme required for sulfatase activity
MKRVLLAILFWLSIGVPAFAETQSVIDPTDGLEPSKPPAAEKKSAQSDKRPAQSDAALKRARQRAESEQRRHARAEARALAAEQERARLRAQEQARQAQAAAAAAAAAREAAARAAAQKAAAARAATRAAAAKATQALIDAEMEAARRDAKAREAAAREQAAREAARQAAVKELAAKEAAGKEIAAREMAARDAAVRDAREVAARLIASREAAAREAGVRLAATREHPPFKDSRATRPAPIGTSFRDCGDCPELVWLPQGEFVMGDAMAAVGARPVVAMKHRLAVGRFEITFAEWDACVAAGGCRRRPHDAGWGRGGQPVVNVSWQDAQQYVAWLSRRTGKRYRLLTEAEWEYAARAGTDARYWWGNHAGRGEANCADCGSRWDGRQAAPVGRFAPNPFGLYDMNGNVSEWVEDCAHDGDKDCSHTSNTRVVRGGAWHGSTRSMRSTSRTTAVLDYFDNRIGFRVARTD